MPSCEAGCLASVKADCGAAGRVLPCTQPAGVRLDGAFDVTVEKLLQRERPGVAQFKWVHQLDAATSGVLLVALNRRYGRRCGSAASVCGAGG